MQFRKVVATALFLSGAQAVPVQKRALTDADILQFALVLEHLENTFYTDALMAMPESEFLAAGFSSDYYNNLKYVAHDEEQHVDLLTGALMKAGASPVAACEYNFPYTDPKSFVGLAAILESVGSAAYLGAAPAITDPTYLTVAGSILVTESIHTAIQRVANGQVAAASPYGSYLIPDAVYTLAASFITSCPSTNAALPFKAFPGLKAVQGVPTAPGIPFEFTTDATLPSSFFVTFINGLTIMSMTPTVNGNIITANVPEMIGGITYVILTNANVTSIMDSDVIAGPVIIEVTPDSPTFGLGD